MARVWFCRDGQSPVVGDLVAELPVAECTAKLAITTSSVRTNLRPSDPLAIAEGNRPRFSEYHHVAVELDPAEVASFGLKAGFYLSPLMPLEAVERLRLKEH